jgi:hypothetical protein
MVRLKSDKCGNGGKLWGGGWHLAIHFTGRWDVLASDDITFESTSRQAVEHYILYLNCKCL